MGAVGALLQPEIPAWRRYARKPTGDKIAPTIGAGTVLSRAQG